MSCVKIRLLGILFHDDPTECQIAILDDGNAALNNVKLTSDMFLMPSTLCVPALIEEGLQNKHQRGTSALSL